MYGKEEDRFFYLETLMKLMKYMLDFVEVIKIVSEFHYNFKRHLKLTIS